MKKNIWRRYMALLLCISLILPWCIEVDNIVAYAETGDVMMEKELESKELWEDEEQDFEDIHREEEIKYKGPLEWLNYFTEEQVVEIFDMKKGELADYLNEIWSHPCIEPVYGLDWKDISDITVGSSGVSCAKMKITIPIQFMRQTMSDEGTLTLSNGSEADEWYNGPFGYRTSHFSVMIGNETAEAFCIDPSAHTPPSGGYRYYIKDGGGSGTATYAAASILYQYEYKRSDFCSMWENAMNIAQVPESDRSRFNLSDQSSCYFMVHSLVSNCWHPSGIWDAGEAEGAYQVAGHQEFKNAFSIFYTMLLLADHPDGYQVYYIDTGKSYQNIVFSNYNPVGRIRVNKLSQNIRIQNDNPEIYSLEGAQYGIYQSRQDAENDSNRVEILTISDGTAISSELSVGTYYVREVKASKGYHLNPEIQEVNVQSGNTAVLSSIETLVSDQVMVRKQSAVPSLVGQDYGYSLAGAEYQIYKDSACSVKAQALVYDENQAVTEVADAVLTTTEDGSSNILNLPRGIYYLKEIKASSGYELDKEVYTIDLNQDHEDIFICTSIELPRIPRLQLQKISGLSDLTSDNPLYSLAGAEYYIYMDSACTVRAQAMILDSDGVPVGNEYGVLTTGMDGRSNILNLLPGTYYIKEIKPSTGYQLDSSVYPVVLSASNIDVIQLECQETPLSATPSVSILKEDLEGISMVHLNDQGTMTSGIGRATLENAVFRIDYYNEYYQDYEMLPESSDAAWHIVTKYNSERQSFEAALKPDYLSSDYPNSPLYYDEYGSVILPLGTIVITEVEAPAGYLLVSEEGVIQDQRGQSEQPYEMIQVVGTDDDQDGYKDQGHIYIVDKNPIYPSPATYTIMQDHTSIVVKEQIKRGDFHFVKTELVSGREMDYIFFRITSSCGESHIICTKNGGYYDSSETAHSQNTNALDQYYDSEGNYLGPQNPERLMREIDQLGDCGIWFFGTADTALWNSDGIKDEKGALRYDADGYLIEELPGPCNKGKQLSKRILYIQQDKDNIWMGNIANIDIPQLQTKEWDRETKGHISTVLYDTDSCIVDTVKYWNLPEDSLFTIKGIIMELNEDGGVIGPLLSASGDLVQSSRVIHTPKSIYPSLPYVSGEEDVEFEFSSSTLGGKRFVIYEYLFEGGDDTDLRVQDQQVVTENVYEVHGTKIMHADPDNKDQSGNFLAIHTHVREKETGTNLAKISQAMQISDVVDYESLTPDYEYKLYGELVYQDWQTGDILPILDADGQPITMVQHFVPREEHGSVTIDFPEFDGYQLVNVDGEIRCAGVTVYVTLYWNNHVIASYKDITDSDETVYIPNIETSAYDMNTGAHISSTSAEVTIIDTCRYERLLPHHFYRVHGIIMDQQTKEPLYDRNGKTIEADITFWTEESNGSIDLVYTFDGSLLQGKTAVVFEDLYYKNIQVASHADMNDASQTIYFPAIYTNLTDTEGNQTLLITDGTEIVLIDHIHFQNLIPGRIYSVQGSLVNQKTGEAIRIQKENGEMVKTELSFRPETTDGDISVEFYFDVDLAGLLREDGSVDVIVCYEELRDVLSNQIIAEHKDLDNQSQMVHFLQRGRVCVRKTVDGIHSVQKRFAELPDDEQVQIVSFHKEPIPCGGVIYTVYDADTNQIVTTFETDEQGYGYSEPLIYGDGRTYYLMETKAAPEYRIDSRKYPIQFSKYIKEDYCSETELMEFHNQVKNVELTIHKQQEQIVYGTDTGYTIATEDAANVYYGIYNREEIRLTGNDASFIQREQIEVIQSNDYVIPQDTLLDIIVTDSNGIAVMKRYLPAGIYYCKELQTAGKEYILDEMEHEFQVQYSGDSNTDCIINVTQEQAFLNKYISRRLCLHKIDDHQHSLPGVEFVLYREENGKYQKVGSYITDQNGQIELARVPYGNYYFIETKGLEGYKYDDTIQYEFSVITDSSVEEDDIQLIIVNERIQEPMTGDYHKPAVLLLGMGISLLLCGLTNLLWKKYRWRSHFTR